MTLPTASKPPLPARRLSRRALAGLGAGIGGALLAGCQGPGEESGLVFVGTPAATPQVPGEPGRWRDRTVRVSAYGGEVEDALRVTVWDPFAAVTGCTVLPVRVDRAAIVGTPTPQRLPDLLLCDPVTAVDLAVAGVASAIPAGILPADLGLAAEDSAPAYSYALVNASQRQAFTPGGAPATWAEWWDVTRYPGPRTLRRDPLGTLEIALLADGVSPGSLYPLDVDRAIAALERVAESVGDRWWTRGVEPVGWIGWDRAILGAAWHHRVVSGQWEGLAVDLDWQQGILATDRWIVPSGAEEPEIAFDLLAFTLGAEAQAAFARETRMGPVNPGAFAFVEPWLLPTIPTAPPQRDLLVDLDAGWWAGEGISARSAVDAWFATLPAASGPPAGS